MWFYQAHGPTNFSDSIKPMDQGVHTIPLEGLDPDKWLYNFAMLSLIRETPLHENNPPDTCPYSPLVTTDPFNHFDSSQGEKMPSIVVHKSMQKKNKILMGVSGANWLYGAFGGLAQMSFQWNIRGLGNSSTFSSSSKKLSER